MVLAARVEDWVVLHGGATAVFRIGSLGKAARLAEALAKVPGLEGSGALLTMAVVSLTVRLSRDTLADRAGNRVCIWAWPDGSTQRRSDGPE